MYYLSWLDHLSMPGIAICSLQAYKQPWSLIELGLGTSLFDPRVLAGVVTHYVHPEAGGLLDLCSQPVISRAILRGQEFLDPSLVPNVFIFQGGNQHQRKEGTCQRLPCGVR